ncbi:hypothetical protein N658DRAFT_498125 [Parathielavia hyrcaniae]|uniref:Uncharacterized protein n=1 Tax=Parathielavia hyrcaniae TaxID=113614 RepID=A0AAN6T0L6_9PEZI|nr:hypothetical protein N658DRAFT_498125 [Parathielavia hyrcaniae]
MGRTQQPYLYDAVRRDDDRFPAAPFDPKAVTRASYERKKLKPKPNGPLVSVNRHPDAHMVPNGRSGFRPMGRRTKGWIKGMRVVQLCLRVLEAVAAAGIIVVMGLSGLIGWIMGATCGVVVLFCLYSIYHHARPAVSKTPGSSSAYHIFSGLSDLCVAPLYAYGAFTTRSKGEEWKTTDLANTDTVRYMVPSVYYGLIAAGGLHLLSLAISLWLGWMFRRIAHMPPDMNPLEANLTSRVHKRNKSSVATSSTFSDEKPEAQLYDDSSRPPSIPFMHTRQNSETSFTSRDSRLNLPSRQYQVAPGNRSSATSQDLKRMSAPPAAHRASYMEVPLGETGAGPIRPTSMHASRPSTGSVASYRPEPVPAAQTAQPRSAKFTETWYASESLINRTEQRNRASTHRGGIYASLSASESDDSDNDTYYTPARGNTDNHPNPLRSHPTTTTPTTITTPPPPPPHLPPSSRRETDPKSSSSSSTPRRPRTPFSRLRKSLILSDLSLNDRRVSGSRDIADQAVAAAHTPRNRTSSIQPDADFLLSAAYSKPYGQLRAGTPPVMVGGGFDESSYGDENENGNGNGNGNARVVSSGNDFGGFDLGTAGGGGGMGRRNVSGRAAEEGRAGARWR